LEKNEDGKKKRKTKMTRRRKERGEEDGEVIMGGKDAVYPP
jgi:hypothetical protein